MQRDELPDRAWRQALRRRLAAWYARDARDLPWRRTSDPYAVWVAEIMLQQTQVATVVGYFERFLAAFPTIAALAAADVQRVLRVWEGLGYYRRARQLHQAARIVVEEHGGRLPDRRDALGRLPGVGRYTAGAILSIAFDRREPILEANTVRLWCRLLGYAGDPRSADGQRLLWAAAEAVLPQRHPGPMNQALMELGSQVCLPRAPRCEECPAATLCRARAEGAQLRLPMPAPRPPYEAVHEIALAVRRRGRYLLVRRPDGGRWAGLWDFPCVPAEGPRASNAGLPAATLDDRGLIEQLGRVAGAAVAEARSIGTIRYGVTRYRVTRECFEARAAGGPAPRASAGHARWLTFDQMQPYPLTAAARRMVGMLGR